MSAAADKIIQELHDVNRTRSAEDVLEDAKQQDYHIKHEVADSIERFLFQSMLDSTFLEVFRPAFNTTIEKMEAQLKNNEPLNLSDIAFTMSNDYVPQLAYCYLIKGDKAHPIVITAAREAPNVPVGKRNDPLVRLKFLCHVLNLHDAPRVAAAEHAKQVALTEAAKTVAPKIKLGKRSSTLM